jgi:S-adenosylmethionine:tRNA ribosyltransferase-isomerase
MLVNEFDFELPAGLIAQSPAPERAASRLMTLNRATGELGHGIFSDLPGLLRAGDVLVINDTKVFPARLNGTKRGTGGRVEALLLKDLGGCRYEALMKGKNPPGTVIEFDVSLSAEVAGELGGGKKLLRFICDGSLDELIERLGRMPLPPYIDQSVRDESSDRERYQTVYASKRGAVAAPTAGLHFTPELLESIRQAGVIIAPVTLHVGIGTFMPVREEVVERHEMQEEEYDIPKQTADAINAAKSDGRRVVCVGTTSARAVESASENGRVREGAGSTRIFIYPGYRFQAVDCLITNFHLPKSTLIMLICALAGKENIMAAYAEAIKNKYRFYSYGDAMFITG